MAHQRSGRPPASARRYRSPLRERQSQQTRDLILDAFAAAVVERGLPAVTMGGVAERVGISERTVYRHFPNATSMLDALSERTASVMRHRGVADVSGTNLEDALGSAEDLYRGFEEAGPPMKAAVIASLTTGYRNPGQPGRVEHIRDAVSSELPRLSQQQLDEIVIMIRYQLGGWAWYLLTEREGLSVDRAAQLSARGVRALMQDLRADYGS